MKIIFDNEEQKKKFIRIFLTSACPDCLGLKRKSNCEGISCSECWEQSGIEMEVREAAE